MILLAPIVAELVPAIAGAVVAGAGYAFYRVEKTHQKERASKRKSVVTNERIRYRNRAGKKARGVGAALVEGATRSL